MVRTCTRCKTEIPYSEQLDPVAQTYPACNKCWAEWREYSVMVINEMRLDMSLPDHRKVLKKYEKVFLGTMEPEGGMKNFADENQRNPDNPQSSQ